ncbi:MAG: hypothetical protein V3S26_02130 [Acidimicrobiia bacterium]|jgi:hypothetical protein
MADNDGRARLGRILSGIGSVWFVLYFVSRFINVGGTPLGDILAFFGSSFFIPLVLLFAGRSIRRRSRRVSVEDALGSPKDPSEQQDQPTPPPAPPPVPRPVQRRPAPPPVEAAPVDADELAKAIGFDPSEETASLPDIEVEEVRPKTSDEMIAEAHRRFNKDG